ncbi:MAG: hypothetical protein U9P68_09080 [Pseudomonadota bacterium]|nr:hypothetical protein [Pseudomonadota bacterium]
MSIIDDTWFDGTQMQSDLTAACGSTPSLTQLSLIARATDGFLVVQGSDAGMTPFDDADISAIFVTFADTVSQYPLADTTTLRTAVLSALAGQWTAMSAIGDNPFDETVDAPARMIFHVHIPGWGFEPARIKFKSATPSGEFCGLSWLTLNGASCEPFSFELGATCQQAGDYEFALFIQASQDAGNQSTRVIIDPKIKVIPPR